MSSAAVVISSLRPSQPNRVMSSMVSLPKHTFTGQAYFSKRLTVLCTFFRQKLTLWLPFLNQRKGETEENISWSNLHERMLMIATQRGLNLQPPDQQLDGASNRATEAGYFKG